MKKEHLHLLQQKNSFKTQVYVKRSSTHKNININHLPQLCFRLHRLLRHNEHLTFLKRVVFLQRRQLTMRLFCLFLLLLLLCRCDGVAVSYLGCDVSYKCDDVFVLGGISSPIFFFLTSTTILLVHPTKASVILNLKCSYHRVYNPY